MWPSTDGRGGGGDWETGVETNVERLDSRGDFCTSPERWVTPRSVRTHVHGGAFYCEKRAFLKLKSQGSKGGGGLFLNVCPFNCVIKIAPITTSDGKISEEFPLYSVMQ